MWNANLLPPESGQRDWDFGLEDEVSPSAAVGSTAPFELGLDASVASENPLGRRRSFEAQQQQEPPQPPRSRKRLKSVKSMGALDAACAEARPAPAAWLSAVGEMAPTGVPILRAHSVGCLYELAGQDEFHMAAAAIAARTGPRVSTSRRRSADDGVVVPQRSKAAEAAPAPAPAPPPARSESFDFGGGDVFGDDVFPTSHSDPNFSASAAAAAAAAAAEPAKTVSARPGLRPIRSMPDLSRMNVSFDDGGGGGGGGGGGVLGGGGVGGGVLGGGVLGGGGPGGGKRLTRGRGVKAPAGKGGGKAKGSGRGRATSQDDKRQRRLARNRISARLRREKKVNHVSGKEHELAGLDEVMALLQSHRWPETETETGPGGGAAAAAVHAAPRPTATETCDRLRRALSPQQRLEDRAHLVQEVAVDALEAHAAAVADAQLEAWALPLLLARSQAAAHQITDDGSLSPCSTLASDLVEELQLSPAQIDALVRGEVESAFGIGATAPRPDFQGDWGLAKVAEALNAERESGRFNRLEELDALAADAVAAAMEPEQGDLLVDWARLNAIAAFDALVPGRRAADSGGPRLFRFAGGGGGGDGDGMDQSGEAEWR